MPLFDGALAHAAGTLLKNLYNQYGTVVRFWEIAQSAVFRLGRRSGNGPIPSRPFGYDQV